MRTHSGDKPYKCSHCNNAFSHDTSLKNHLKRHTGEKPYQCNHCDKAFIVSCLLKDHLRTHTGEKPFPCHQCDKAFSQNAAIVILNNIWGFTLVWNHFLVIMWQRFFRKSQSYNPLKHIVGKKLSITHWRKINQWSQYNKTLI